MRCCLLIVALLATSACGGGLIRSPGASQQEVEALERQAAELKRRATVSEMNAARLKHEMAVLEEQLESAEQAPAQSPEPEAEGVTLPAPGSLAVAEPRIEETDLEEVIEETDLEEGGAWPLRCRSPHAGSSSPRCKRRRRRPPPLHWGV